VGDEGPPFASESQVREALDACRINTGRIGRNSDNGQYEVTLYDDEPDTKRKVNCLEAEMRKNAVSFAIWSGIPRGSGTS
jgi:hypothetical protein